jgi:hypothetical protein
MQQFVVDVGFQCPKCKSLNQKVAWLPEPQWSGVSQLSQIGGECQLELKCNTCTTEFEATANYSGLDARVVLDDYPETRVETSTPGYTASFDADWWSQETPANPRSIFTDSYHHVGEILAEHGGELGTDLVNRMVFAQQIGALEAYLADTLVKSVLAKPEAVKRLLAGDPYLKAKTFTLPEIVADPDLINREVRVYLKSLIYHRLDQVTRIYQIALDVNIWPSDVTKAELFKAVRYRHDCVHRNGYTPNDVQLDIFTKAWVQGVAEATRQVVDCIESRLSAASAE